MTSRTSFIPRRIAWGLGAALMLLVLLLGINTARFSSRVAAPAAPVPAPAADPAAVARLAQAIRIPTVSSENGHGDPAALEAFAAFLARSYPRVQATLHRETIAGHSLLYTWTGTDPSLPPVLLASHMDVVPVEAGTEAAWTHPPFAGVVADGFVWGRGTLDDKVGVLGILEAVERALSRGVRPRRTIYLAFGHDEEMGGNGAKAIAAVLKSRGIRLDMVLDEGLVVTEGLLPGVARPVALVGVAEKGSVSIELVVKGTGGHASMPSDDNVILKLSHAVDRIVAHPFPARLIPPLAATFDQVGPSMGLMNRLMLANRWLTEPLVVRSLLKAPPTAAMVRTTIAPTILAAGTKENVLPQEARAVINLRILPGETVASVVDHVRRAVDEAGIEIRALPGAREPSPISPMGGPAFIAIERAIAVTYPEAIVAPALAVVRTDARSYAPVATAIYRFLPVRLTPADLSRVHGTDERIAIPDYLRAIDFYGALIETAGR